MKLEKYNDSVVELSTAGKDEDNRMSLFQFLRDSFP